MLCSIFEENSKVLLPGFALYLIIPQEETRVKPMILPKASVNVYSKKQSPFF